MSRVIKGWVRDLPDHRDYRLAEQIILPPEVPQVKYLINPPVKDQGEEGSCVFNAVSTAMEVAQAEQDNLYPPLEYSRHYAYYQYRKAQGIPLAYDSGASIRDVIKQIAREGVCFEFLWPYAPATFAQAPAANARQDAAKHKIKEYFALNSLEEMLACLALGWGFVCGISCYESIDSEITSKSGFISLPGPSERFVGGHAIYVCGYDKHQEIFHLQNSWGGEWGREGRGRVPFAYLATPGLASDFWTIRR